jgi:hypothetical protein
LGDIEITPIYIVLYGDYEYAVPISVGIDTKKEMIEEIMK